MADKINGPIPPLPTAGTGWQTTPGGPEPDFFQQGTAVDNTTVAVTYAAADIAGGILTTANAGATALTLPLATDLDTYLASAPVNSAFDFSVINTGAGTATITTNTGWTLKGSMAVATNVSGRFRARRTATGAWTCYRMA